MGPTGELYNALSNNIKSGNEQTIQNSLNTLYSNTQQSEQYAKAVADIANNIQDAQKATEAYNAIFGRLINLLDAGKLTVDNFNSSVDKIGFNIQGMANLNNIIGTMQEQMQNLQTNANNIFSSLDKLDNKDKELIKTINEFKQVLQNTNGTISQTNFEKISDSAAKLIDVLDRTGNSGNSAIKTLNEIAISASNASASMTENNEILSELGTKFAQSISASSQQTINSLQKIQKEIGATSDVLKTATDADYEFFVSIQTDKIKSGITEAENLIKHFVEAKSQGGDFSAALNMSKFTDDLKNILQNQQNIVSEFQQQINSASNFNQIDLGAKAAQTILSSLNDGYLKQIEVIKNTQGLEGANDLISKLQDARSQLQQLYHTDIQNTADAYNKIANEMLRNATGNNISTVNISGINNTNIGAFANQLQKQAILGAIPKGISSDYILGESRRIANVSNIFNEAAPRLLQTLNGSTDNIISTLFENGRLKSNSSLSTLIQGSKALNSEALYNIIKQDPNSEAAKTAQDIIKSQQDLNVTILALIKALQAQLNSEGKKPEANALNDIINTLQGDINNTSNILNTAYSNIGTKIDKTIDILRLIDKGITSLPDSMRGYILPDGIGYLFNKNVRNMMGDGTQAYQWAAVSGMTQNELQNNAKNYAVQEEQSIYELSKLASTYNWSLNTNDIVKNQSNYLYNISGGKIGFNDLSQNYMQSAQIGMLNENELANISQYATTLGTARSDTNAQQIISSIKSLHRNLGIEGDDGIIVFDRITQAADNSGIAVNEYANAIDNMSSQLRYLKANGTDISNIVDTFGNILSQSNVTISDLESMVNALTDSLRYLGGSATDVNNALNDFAGLSEITGIPMKDIQSSVAAISEPLRYMGANASDVTTAVLKLGVASNELNLPMRDMYNLFTSSSESLRYLGADSDTAVNATLKLAEMAANSKYPVKDYQQAFSGVADQIRMMGGDTESALSMMNRITAVAEKGTEPINSYTSAYTSLSNQFRTLGLDGEQAINVLSSMSTLALRTGTPISDYVSIINSLTTAYMDAGLNANNAFSVFANLQELGLSTHDSQGIAQNFVSSLSRFSQDESQIIMSGILQGNGDIFGNLFNSQYVTSGHWGEDMASQMDTMLQFNRFAFGNGALGDWQTLKKLQSYGFTQKQSSEIFEELQKGNINGLSDLLNSKDYMTADDATIDMNKTIGNIDKQVSDIRNVIVGEKGVNQNTDTILSNARNEISYQSGTVGTITEMNADAQFAAKNQTSIVEQYAQTLERYQSANIDTLTQRMDANYRDMTNYLNSSLGEFLQNNIDIVPTLKSILGVVTSIAVLNGITTIGSGVNKGIRAIMNRSASTLATQTLSSSGSLGGGAAGGGAASATATIGSMALAGALGGGVSGVLGGGIAGYNNSKDITQDYVNNYTATLGIVATQDQLNKYSEILNKQSDAIVGGTLVGAGTGLVSGAATGAAVGAALGTVVPVFGNAVGAIAGAIIGGIAGTVTGGLAGGKFADTIMSNINYYANGKSSINNLLSGNYRAEVYDRIEQSNLTDIVKDLDIKTATDAITSAITDFKDQTKGWTDQQLTAFGIYADSNKELLNSGQTSNAQLLSEFTSYKTEYSNKLKEINSTWDTISDQLSSDDEATRQEAKETLKKLGANQDDLDILATIVNAEKAAVQGTVQVSNLPAQAQAINDVQEEKLKLFVQNQFGTMDRLEKGWEQNTPYIQLMRDTNIDKWGDTKGLEHLGGLDEQTKTSIKTLLSMPAAYSANSSNLDWDRIKTFATQEQLLALSAAMSLTESAQDAYVKAGWWNSSDKSVSSDKLQQLQNKQTAIATGTYTYTTEESRNLVEQWAKNKEVTDELNKLTEDNTTQMEYLTEAIAQLQRNGLSVNASNIVNALLDFRNSTQVQANAFQDATSNMNAKEILDAYGINIKTTSSTLDDSTIQTIYNNITNAKTPEQIANLSSQEQAIRNTAISLAESYNEDFTSYFAPNGEDLLMKAIKQKTNNGEDVLQSTLNTALDNLNIGDAFKLKISDNTPNVISVMTSGIKANEITGIKTENGIKYYVQGTNVETNEQATSTFENDENIRDYLSGLLSGGYIQEYGFQEDLYKNYILKQEESANKQLEASDKQIQAAEKQQDIINQQNGYLGAGQLLLSNDAIYGNSYFNGSSDATTDWQSIKNSINGLNNGLVSPYDSQGLSIGMRNQSAVAAYGSLPEANQKSNITINYTLTKDEKEILDNTNDRNKQAGFSVMEQTIQQTLY